MPPTVVHLHGLGSSPGSEKAVALAARLRGRGVTYLVPDLNVPSFERLTLTAVLERLEEIVTNAPGGPVALVGSSFGGLAALHFTDRRRPRPAAARVERLVLLAPALDLEETAESGGDGTLAADWLERWRSEGTLELPHPASGGTRPVHYGLVRDLRSYDSFAVEVDLPILIYHGRADESVPHEQSVRFAAGRDNVTLRLLDSDHRLAGRLDEIAGGIIDFLEV